MPTLIKDLQTSITVLMVLVALSGCLGGNKRDPSSPSAPLGDNNQPTCSVPRVQINSPDETNADYSKAIINAQAAYSMGLTGHCIQVVVIDSGLSSQAHADLPRARVDIVKDRAWALVGDASITYADTPVPPLELPDGDMLSFSAAYHGTGVSSLIAAASDGYGMHGVAPGSVVRHLTLAFDDSDSSQLPGELAQIDSIFGMELALLFRIAMPYGSIFNMSWGWNAAPSHPEPNPTAYGAKSHYTEEELRAAFGPPPAAKFRAFLTQTGLPLDSVPGNYDFIALAGQAYVDEDDRKIFVWAAGNGGNPVEEGTGRTFPFNPLSPGLPAGLQGRISELQGHWLSVVAIDQTGEIADFSNHCGAAREYCLAAPGVCVLAATAYSLPLAKLPAERVEYPAGDCTFYDPDIPHYLALDGTSLSAPIVSGALALMIERFRGQLGNTAVVRRMLDTADKTGSYADSSIYGQGLLNIGAAVLPVGQQQLSLQGHAVSLPDLNTAFTDPFHFIPLLQNAISGQQVMVRDELGGPFWLHFNALPGASPAPRNPAWTAPVTLISRNRKGGGTEYLGSGGRNSTVPGYALDTGVNGAWGFFAATGLSPAALTGLRLSSLRSEDFGRDTAFAAPWLDLVAHGSIGAGARLQTSLGNWTLAGFQGRASARAPGDADNRLTLLEYRLSSRKLDLLLQRGSIEEPDSWAGAWTENSIYGHFAGRMQFAGLTAAWHLTLNWQLLGATQWMRMHLKPLSQGLLLELTGLRDRRLELGALGRSVLLRGDSLGLRWQARQQSSGRALWRLPQRLYRRQIQYSDLALELRSPLYQSLELSWQVPLQSNSSLLIGLGRNAPGSLLNSMEVSDYATLQFALSF